MTLLGEAAVAMWWDMAPASRSEFEDWHSHEHFPERMGIPGFLRGSRWASSEGTDGFFVLYELVAYETLTSSHYLARLNDPTPWSKKMMPLHRNMVRSQCRVIESFGGGIARAMMTLRLSPQPGRAESLRTHLKTQFSELQLQPGLTGAHLLTTQTPDIAPTHEQKIRGGADAVADWIVLVSGYDAWALSKIASGRLGHDELSEMGMAGTPQYSFSIWPMRVCRQIVDKRCQDCGTGSQLFPMRQLPLFHRRAKKFAHDHVDAFKGLRAALIKHPA